GRRSYAVQRPRRRSDAVSPPGSRPASSACMSWSLHRSVLRFDIRRKTCHSRCTVLCNERRQAMIIDVNTLEAAEMGGGMSVTFPFSSATGMAASAAVYIVLEPGGVLPEHTDSAEEWLLVLEGEVEATVAGQTVTLGEGHLAWVPAIAPHSAVNTSDGP